MGAEVNAKEILRLPPTHVVLIASIEDAIYLLDPGFNRLPVLVTGGMESIHQPSDEMRFYYLEHEKLYVLERMTGHGWLRLIQTDLRPLAQVRIEFNLMQLEQCLLTLGIRDEKFVMGRLLPQGQDSVHYFGLLRRIN